MKTPVEQAIEALDKMGRMLFSYHSGAPVKVEDLQSEVKAALASLKSMEDDRAKMRAERDELAQALELMTRTLEGLAAIHNEPYRVARKALSKYKTE